MKRTLLVLLSWMAFIPIVVSQENLSAFLFDEYKDAIVYFKGNRQSGEKVNYNMIDDKLYFVDKKDNQVKVVSGIENIVYIKVGERSFLIEEDGMKEVVSSEPLIYVQYKAKVQRKATKGAYGGTSKVSSASSYTELRDGGAHALVKNYETEASSYYNYYWIEKNGKKRKFTDFKQFLKIYSKQKKDLEKYIDDKKISFEDVNAIIELCIYAENL